MDSFYCRSDLHQRRRICNDFSGYRGVPFSECLTRMHAAAMGDTLGLGLIILGLIVLFGFTFTTVKLVLVVAFLWTTGPVSSHLIAQMMVEKKKKREEEEKEK